MAAYSPTARPMRGRQRLPSRRRLFSDAKPTSAGISEAWSDEENKALVEFVLFHCDPAVWPSHSKTSKFWKDAADFVHQRSKTTVKRSGMMHCTLYLYINQSHLFSVAGACRLKVISKYPKQFRSPADAESYYFGPEQPRPDSPMDVDVPQQQVIKHEVSTQTDLSGAVSNQVRSHNSDFVLEILEPMSTDDQLKFMANFLTKFANTHYDVHVNSDFLQFFLDASRHLKECNRPNVVYGVAKAIGRMRPDRSDSRLPAKRMPMGLLQHMVNFFNADTYNKVRNNIISHD